MADHISRFRLERLFSGTASQAEVDAYLPHVGLCPHCSALAVVIVNELRGRGALASVGDARANVGALVREQQRAVIELLQAKAWWAELQALTPEQQIKKFRTTAYLHSGALFETLLIEAERNTQLDPHAAEEAFTVSHSLASLLPESRFPSHFKKDLQGRAMTMIANCRRLLADWNGSLAAAKEARLHLAGGTGDPELEANLLSIHASLALDMGRLESALEYLGRELRLHDEQANQRGKASAQVHSAAVMLAANRAEEAAQMARKALTLVEDKGSRLAMLGRGILVESFVALGRSDEAMGAYAIERELFQRHATGSTRLNIAFIEARLLECSGRVRDSEKLFRYVAEGYFELELYKDTFRVLLTLFESLFRRGAFARAAELCEHSLKLLEMAGREAKTEMVKMWQKLRGLVAAQELQVAHVLEAQQYLMRNWVTPFAEFPSAPAGRPLQKAEIPAEPDTNTPFISEPARIDYHGTLERLDRELIREALSQTGGRIRETCRLLGISRNGLKSKLRRHGLAAQE